MKLMTFKNLFYTCLPSAQGLNLKLKGAGVVQGAYAELGLK